MIQSQLMQSVKVRMAVHEVRSLVVPKTGLLLRNLNYVTIMGLGFRVWGYHNGYIYIYIYVVNNWVSPI